MTLEAQRVYRQIYEENAGRIFGYIFRKIYDKTGAEDIKQEVFIALLFKLQDFLPSYPKNSASIKAWLFGVADNKIKLYWRDNQGRFDAEVSLDALEDMVDLRDEFSGVEFTFPKWLDPEERQLLALKMSGYSLKEIAGRLGVSYEACRQRSSRLMRQLGEYYKNNL